MRILSTTIASAAFTAVVGFSSAATAQDADDAFQKVALLNAELTFLHEANLTTAPADTQGQAVLVDRPAPARAAKGPGSVFPGPGVAGN